jgi:general secretion pathway protein A
LRQLAQRITGRYHLMPLSSNESRAYVNHRLTVAGAVAPIFTGSALRTVQRVTQGIPRLINIICDRALLGAYTRELRQVDAGLVRHAAREVLGEEPAAHRPLWPLAAALALAAALLLWTAGTRKQETGSVASPPLKAAAAVPSLPDWLADPTHPADTDTAFATLFSLWGARYTPAGGGSGCREAELAGLRCLYRRGNWNDLKSYNLPAILTLTDASGTPHQLVVTALDGGQVTLKAGGAMARFPLAAAEPLWYGEYLLLWRPDAASAAPLLPGMTGTSVQWLRSRLAGLKHGTDTGVSSYDDGLVTAVKEFQTEQHLRVDGIAGEETLVRLSALTAPAGTPRLDPGGG